MSGNLTKENAFQELVRMAKNNSFDVYETTGDIYGSRAWEVDCFKPLDELRYSKKKTRQQALDETLMNLTRGDFPKTRKRMEEEKKVIRLTLSAGANPNYSDSYHGSVFDSFWYSEKGYGLLEVVQNDRFESPKKLQEFYGNFCFRPLYCSSTGEEFLLSRKENKNRADLIYTLFQKGMYPTNPRIFEKLAPTVLEKDPNFFEKKKQQVIRQITRAETPMQIYNVLMGQGKEKS